MFTKTLKQLSSIKDELNDLLETKSDNLIDSTNSTELQVEIQKNVIDYISETIEQIDIILEEIEDGSYDDGFDEIFDDY